MPDRFRLAIVGAGIFSEANHFPSLSTVHFDDVDRLAVCDVDRSRAAKLAAKYGWGKVYTDLAEMLAKEELDGCVVCVGGARHPEVASRVIEAGVPVFLEKPSSTDVVGTKRLAERAAARNVIVQVGHQKRHSTPYRRARAIVSDTASFGNIVQVESKMHGFTVFPTFYTCMLEWQCHNLDIVTALAGPIAEIEAKAHLVSECTGGLTAILRFESGAVGTLGWGTFGGPGPYVERVEIVSDRGQGVIVTNARVVTHYEPDSERSWEPDWNPISPNQSHVFNGYVPQLRAFIESVRSGVPSEPTITDEVRTMHWLHQIALSAGIPTDWAPVASGS